jgi:hypothetical protein
MTTNARELAELATAYAGGNYGMRNRIINGDMRIDQRNNGAAVTVNQDVPRFPVDRFIGVGQASDGVFTLQQDSSAPAGFTNSIKATVTTADSSIAAAQQYFIAQHIEGNNLSDLSYGTSSAQTITMSFWVRSSITGAFGGAINNFLSSRHFVFSYTINSADTWEYKTVTIPGDTASAMATNNSTGVRVLFSLGAGSSRQQVVGTWQTDSGAFKQTFSGATQLIATNGATFYITGVQLEAGSVATPFERRPFGTELALCQRYFQRFSAIASTTRRVGTTTLLGTMRATPTLTVTFDAGSGATYTTLADNATIFQNTEHNTFATASILASSEL